jgi:hypothetical protein
MDTVLQKQTMFIFRAPPEDANSKVLWNTATQFILSNLVNIVYSLMWNPEAKNLVEAFMLEELNYKYVLFLTNLAFNVAALCTTSVLRFLLPSKKKKKSKRV